MMKTAPPGDVLEALIRRGWCFRDVEDINGLIQIMVLAKGEEMGSLGLIESELLNMDLREIGGKSLPDPSAIKKLSHLQGPKIVQLVSVRDIHQSSIEASFGSSHGQRRLLRFSLTDGHMEIIAIEYAPIPSISQDIVPGTKIRLENKIAIHSGILCLDSKVVAVLGGLVQSLYEEWQMSQKYSGFSRSSLRLSQSDGVGPPPFEKLQIGAHPYQVVEQHSLHSGSSHPPQSTSRISVRTNAKSSGNSDDRQMGGNLDSHLLDRGQRPSDPKEYKIDGDLKIASITGIIEEKPSSSESRPKEVIEALPVQNQAAAQKLLQKMSQSSWEGRPSRGPKYRGKGKEEDPEVFTLDEWEKRKGVKSLVNDGFQDINRDEELARQLQNQLDFEDYHVNTGHQTEAEQIRMNMFNFGREEERRNDSRKEFRGRGRGRGRGKRRFG